MAAACRSALISRISKRTIDVRLRIDPDSGAAIRTIRGLGEDQKPKRTGSGQSDRGVTLMALRPLTRPEHWWSRAEEMRTFATEMRDPQARASMLRVAEEYEHLARRAEERLRKRGR